MIELYGLNSRQVELLNILWNIDEMDEVEALISTLSERDQMECKTLMSLLVFEILDDSVNLDESFPQAQQVINHIKSL